MKFVFHPRMSHKHLRNRSTDTTRCLLTSTLPLVLLLGFVSNSFGLATEQVGPVKGPHAKIRQPGWPHNVLEILQHPSRVYSREVNGDERIYYNADAAELAELVQQFAKIRQRDHLIILKRSEKSEVTSFRGESYGYNVDFHLPGGLVLGMRRMEAADGSTFEPVLTISIGQYEHPILFDDIKWPDSVIVKNEIPKLKIASKGSVPARKRWHARINFKDGKPAVDFEAGVQTRIALWEKGNPLEFDLGNVTHKGTFSVALSDAEVAKLKSGEMWLNTTVGNWLAKPKPSHPKLDFEKFSLDPKKAEVISVAKSQLYYGQIVFEGGGEFELAPEPWPGGAIHVTFSFAGMVRPDKKGNFSVTLTEEQFKELKAKKARKNIYVPDYGKKGRSTALLVFPAEKLTTDPKKPGVVTIPRP